MALNLTAIAQQLRTVADQLDGTVLAPGGKAVNPVKQAVAAADVPSGYEAGTVKIVKVETSDKDGKPYVSLALSMTPDQPLRWINVYVPQLYERVHAVPKNTRVAFQTKPGVEGKPGRIVTDIFVV